MSKPRYIYYLCQWDGLYGTDIPDELHTLDFFTEDRGYGEDDRDAIFNLEHTERYVLEFGHIVTAVVIDGITLELGE